MAKGTTVRMWRRSFAVLIGMVVVGFGVIVARLVQLQLVDSESLRQKAVNQQLMDTTISAQRGTIYDCNMKPLAQSATVWQVVMAPAYLKTDEDRELVAKGLAEILGLDEAKLLEKANNTTSYYTIVQRRVESDVKDKIVKFKEEHKIDVAISLHEDYKRYYPYGQFAATILGFTGDENQGLDGLEAKYNSYLTGVPGRLVTAKNAVGTDMPFDYEQMVPAQNGYSLVLTIDEVIQHYVEKYLEEGIQNNDVRNRATAIVMEPSTGAILALAVKGDYDPNNPFTIADSKKLAEIKTLPEDQQAAAKSQALADQWRNKAVSDIYYPGSVFKMITASMGIEEGVVNENTHFFCSGSYVAVPGTDAIRCHKTDGHGDQTFVQALCNSCNPAFIQLGQKLGTSNFYKYYSAFGLSEKTGVDLPGEVGDLFFSQDGAMSEMDLAVSSFGQNFGITPIQMVTAMAAVANGGYLVQPHIVQQIIDDDGNIVKSAESVVKRQVISEETSKRVSAILETNATQGSGKNGYVEGYHVAGKTGTSEKIGQQITDEGKDYIASYGGYAPADDAKVVMLVFYDTPKGDSYYGSYVAAPTFCNVMKEILPYLGVERRYSDEELANLGTTAPSVVGKTIAQAKGAIQSAELKTDVYGTGDTVAVQIPEAGKPIPKNGTVVLYTDASMALSNQVTVPDLTNRTMSDVNAMATNAGLNVSFTGAGLNGASEGTTDSGVISYSQDIPANTTVSRGTVITVEILKPDNVE